MNARLRVVGLMAAEGRLEGGTGGQSYVVVV